MGIGCDNNTYIVNNIVTTHIFSKKKTPNFLHLLHTKGKNTTSGSRWMLLLKSRSMSTARHIRARATVQ